MGGGNIDVSVLPGGWMLASMLPSIMASVINQGEVMENYIGYAFLIGMVVLNITLLVICWQKGREAYFWIGLLFGVTHWIGALRLAKPGSKWYVKRYDERKQAMSRLRFNEDRIQNEIAREAV